MKKVELLCLLMLLLCSVSPVFAAYDMYLQIEGVAGTQSDAGHKDWIPVSEIQDNMVKPGTTIALVINKPIDNYSGPLYKNCIMGTPNPRAILDVCKDGVVLCHMMMTSPSISQIKPKFTKTDASPMEELTLNFKSITWDFYSIGADGKQVMTRTGWDNDLKRTLQ